MTMINQIKAKIISIIAQETPKLVVKTRAPKECG